MITLVSVGDRVRPGIYALHARFRLAVHFHGPEGLAFVVDERVGAGPVNIVIRGGDLGSIDDLSVSGRSLVVNGKSFGFGDSQVYRSVIGPPAKPGPRFRESLAALEECIMKSAHPLSLAFLLDAGREDSFRGGFAREFIKRIRAGVSRMGCGDLAGGAASIRGCGFGLTPSGDDFLAGVLIAMHVRQGMDGRSLAGRIDTIRRACGKGSLLADTFLRLAGEGRVDEGMKRLVSALAGADAARIRRSAKEVLDHGATSGADLATGFLIALRWERGTGDANDC